MFWFIFLVSILIIIFLMCLFWMRKQNEAACLQREEAERNEEKCNIQRSTLAKVANCQTKSTYTDAVIFQDINPYHDADMLYMRIENQQMAQDIALRAVNIINDCEYRVNTTRNPDVFFEKYDLMISQIRALIHCEEFLSFEGNRPKDMLEYAISTRQQETEKFIGRYWKATCEKAEKLKTEKAKQKHYDAFYWMCKHMSCHMDESNVRFFSDLYESMSNEPILKTNCLPFGKSNATAPADESPGEREYLSSPSDFNEKAYDEENQRIIERFEKLYNLNTIEGILGIPLRDFRTEEEKFSIVSAPEQILQKKATAYKKAGKMDLAIACLRKSNEFMDLTDTIYTVNNYMRLVDFLYTNKQFDEARAEKQKIYDKCGGSEIDMLMRLMRSGISGEREEEYYKRVIIPAKAKANDKEEYYWLLEYLPALAPKSFGGYRRMKSLQTSNFFKIKEAAREKGKVIN